MHLHPIPPPFAIPEDLREVLASQVLAYGTGGGIGQNLPCCAAWSIRNDCSAPIGYAWFTEHGPEDQKALHVSIAVLPQHQAKGTGTFALTELEREARQLGFQKLQCQVNSNRPDGGQRVRRWLLAQGYVVSRDAIRIPDAYKCMPDDQFAISYPGVVYFYKSVQ